MAWRIGIDEAGYGPNLGPLVMTVVACRVPDEKADIDLWELLQAGVRRHGGRDDGRLVVADSKLVFSSARGIGPLERTVLATLFTSLYPSGPPLFIDLGSLLALLAPDGPDELEQETWYTGSTAIPIKCEPSILASAHARLHAACRDAGVAACYCRTVVVCTSRFNELTDVTDSKGAVLSHALIRLLRACMAASTAEPMVFAIDKHGGRNQYGPTLDDGFPDGKVRPRKECSDESVYDIDGLDRAVRLTFMPRADGTHFPVALASMISKYVREALMREFNAFWQGHIPELRPTAGYPEDAVRFFGEIRPVVEKLGLCERQVWRRK